MKVLFYKPFMVYNPRVAIILDEMEIEIMNGNEVIFFGCDGELINGCIYNPFKQKSACKSCKYFKKKDLGLLSKKVKTYTFKDFLPDLNKYSNLSWKYDSAEEIKNINYKNVDIGYASLSAYIQQTRNHKPKITEEFRQLFDQYLNVGAIVTDAMINALEIIQPQNVGIFNARIHSRKPVLRICQQKNIRCRVYESTGFASKKLIKKVEFENCMPHDIEYNTFLMQKTWDDSLLSTEEKEKISSDFYIQKTKGLAIDDKSYVKSQKHKMLPEDWDNKKINITIFNSSDDEFSSLGKDWEYKFDSSKIDTIQTILNAFINDEKYHFYLRVHPNLTRVKYKYITELFSLEKNINITIIPPESSVSSYALLFESQKIITFGSAMGIEAVYWNKPSILLGPSMYKLLNVNFIPKNHSELIRLIKEPLIPKDRKNTLIYSFYRLQHGKHFKYFDPNPYKRREVYIKNKLIFSFNEDYRDKMYNNFLPPFFNFIKYKSYSLPKNIMFKFVKNKIPKFEE